MSFYEVLLIASQRNKFVNLIVYHKNNPDRKFINISLLKCIPNQT